MDFDTIIVGGGAAGLMCAIEAGKRNRKVAVLEKAGSLGKKILISGGGRCNFTNIHCSPENYISDNPHFCKSALSRYTPFHFIELVEQYNIAYHEKTLGQQFCDGSARQIVDLLRAECDKYNVTFYFNTNISEINKDSNFEVTFGSNVLRSETIVIASGGLSIPKMGSTDFGHKTAIKFGHSLSDCRPGLVPLTFSEAQLKTYSSLSGIALPVVTTFNDQSFKESLLFTHRGVSGPAVLQISSYWKRGQKIQVDLFPDDSFLNSLTSKKAAGEKSELKTVLSQHFSKKFAEALAAEFDATRPINQFSDKQLAEIAQRVHQWEIDPTGTEGYPKAEVTVGGVNTDQISSKTMESKIVPGMFLIGEVVDVTGHLGGFNFQWAWASGFAAGNFC